MLLPKAQRCFQTSKLHGALLGMLPLILSRLSCALLGSSWVLLGTTRRPWQSVGLGRRWPINLYGGTAKSANLFMELPQGRWAGNLGHLVEYPYFASKGSMSRGPPCLYSATSQHAHERNAARVRGSKGRCWSRGKHGLGLLREPNCSTASQRPGACLPMILLRVSNDITRNINTEGRRSHHVQASC